MQCPSAESTKSNCQSWHAPLHIARIRTLQPVLPTSYVQYPMLSGCEFIPHDLKTFVSFVSQSKKPFVPDLPFIYRHNAGRWSLSSGLRVKKLPRNCHAIRGARPLSQIQKDNSTCIPGFTFGWFSTPFHQLIHCNAMITACNMYAPPQQFYW